MSKFGKRDFRIGDYWISQRSGSAAYYRTWYDGEAEQTRRLSLGTDDYEEAKRKLEDWYMAQRMRHAQDLAPDEVKLAEVFRDYLDNHAAKLRSYKTLVILLRYWEEFYAAGTVADVRDVRRQEEFRAFLAAKGLAHNSVNRTLEAGRAAITRAFKRGVVTAMPYVHCLPAETDKPKGRPLAVDEISRMYAASSDHIRLFMILMLGTGARNEAITGLTWPQIDFDDGLIHLNPEGRRQTSKRRPVVRLVPFVRETLEPLDRSKPRVIIFRGQPVDEVTHRIRRAVARAKLPGEVSAYSFRHTVARWLRKEGVTPWETAMLLGHKMAGFSMTERYASASPDYLEASTKALDKLLRTAVPLDAPKLASGR